MGKYDISKHSIRLFPWFWQNLTNMALLDVITSVFTRVNDDFETKETDTRQRVGYSIQRLSLESSLNDRFDPIQRRIVVTNSLSGGGAFLFNEAETIPTSLEFFTFNEGESIGAADESFVFNESEPSGSAIEPFQVVCPTDVLSLERQIRAWIEAVQITGTNYELTFI